LRNSRTGNFPNLFELSKDCESFGAEGITVHPRPDERHIRYSDVPVLKGQTSSEFNIEGNPIPKFLDLVLATKPDQCTLVPDAPNVLTSDTGWDTIKNADFLKDIIAQLREAGIRVSLFCDPIEEMVEGAKAVGADRIELYTGTYAHEFKKDKHHAVAAHVAASKLAANIGLGLNAGHDLNLNNLGFYKDQVVDLLEVSIGHALIADALYFGLKTTIQKYLATLKEGGSLN